MIDALLSLKTYIKLLFIVLKTFSMRPPIMHNGSLIINLSIYEVIYPNDIDQCQIPYGHHLHTSFFLNKRGTVRS